MHPFFFEIHNHLEREGPGSFSDTKRALGFADTLSDHPRILDVACGPGAQTLDLARLTNGTIHSVDRHEPFVQRLKASVRELGLESRVFPSVGEMQKIGFPEASFDLIWCEGAAYIMGFEEALRSWKPLLSPGGTIAVTEPVWLHENPPPEALDNWRDYPAMTSIEGNIAKIKNCGYSLVAHFTLSAQGWENYYAPLENRALNLLQNFAGEDDKRALIEETLSEVRAYRKFAPYFGYEFFIMR